MRSLFIGFGCAFVLVALAVAFRLLYAEARPGLPGCPARHEPGHPAPVPLQGTYFQTGTLGGRWGDGMPPEVALDAAGLRAGAGLYARDCRTCHGALGLGDGVMTRIPGGPAPGSVASLQQPEALARPDGELFGIVTRGRGRMIGYGDTLPAADRWRIVAYLRALQASQHGTAADLASASRSPLPAPAAETGLGAPTPAEVNRLATSGWIDRQAGTVHVPLERALETTLEQLRRKPVAPATPLSPDVSPVSHAAPAH